MTTIRSKGSTLRRTLQALLLITCSEAAFSADYFVSPSGNDNNNGTSVSSPWRTIAKANALLRAGDTLYLRGGEYVNDPIAPTASGRSGAPIKYMAYQRERPVLTSNTVKGLKNAIHMRGVSYVVVHGITVDGKAPAPAATVAHFVMLDTASYIEIRDCDFKYAEGWAGIEFMGNAHHNLILRNRIDFVGEWARGDVDHGDSIWIAAESHHNLIASNFLTHGGHDLLRTRGYNNIVQDNVFDNDWSDVEGTGLGARNLTLDGTNNVFQRNIVRGTKRSVDSPWNQAMKVEGTGNIVRRNLVLDNHHDAFATAVGSWQQHARNARIYNNTIFNNGGAAWRVRYYENPERPYGNVFMNNLVYGNRQSPSNNTNDSDLWMYLRESGVDAPSDNLAINNLIAKVKAGDGRVYLDPPQLLGPLSDAERRYPQQIFSNIQAVPTFVSTQRSVFRDFELASGSPGQDAAAPLTTTMGTGSGTAITVVDASWFNDGYGLGAGDLISVGNERDLRVLRVDLAANKLLLDRSIGWSDGAPVHLEYAGRAPDIGAVESGRAAMFSVQPKAPRLTGKVLH